MLGEESYRAWGDLLYSAKTGEPAFDRVFNMRRFEYLALHPEAAAVFNEAMAGFFGRVHAAVVKDKQKVTVRFQAADGHEIAGVFGVRMIRADAERRRSGPSP